MFVHAELAFPLLDLLRCLVRWPRASETIFQPENWAHILRVSGLDDAGAIVTGSDLSTARINCSLFVFRLMANAVAADADRMKTSSTASVPTSLLAVFEEIRRLVKLIDSPALAVFDKKKNHMVSLFPSYFRFRATCSSHQLNRSY